MDPNEEPNFNFKPQKNKKKLIVKTTVYITVFVFILFLVFSSQIVSSEQGTTSWISKLPIISHVKRLVENADKTLKGEKSGRINILLLGTGGKNHAGGLLTDTIILVSLNLEEKKVALLSIPRDLSAPIEGKGWRKINNVNAYAEIRARGSGGLAVSQAISDILDIPIDYYLRLDFEGFVNIVNELGNINIYVDNTIDDKTYPILGNEEVEPYENRFEHLHIEEGWQKMDGELALKYVRSRHSGGVEGSDFARSKRQQKILKAVKEKLFSKYILFKPRMITNIIEELDEHVSTNLKIWEIVKLWNIFKNIENKNITNKGLNNGPGGFLVDMINESGAYILVPSSGDFAEIQYMVNNIFSDAPAQTKTRVVTEKTSIEILNGTLINGLASEVAIDLKKYGFEIIRIGNFNKQDFEKSTIYDLTYGEKINSLTVLREKTGANINFGLPEWLIDDLAKQLDKKNNIKQPDLIFIVGQDMDPSASGIKNIEE